MRRPRKEVIVGGILFGMLLGCRHREGRYSELPEGKPPELPTVPPYIGEPLVATFEKQARGFSDTRWKDVLAKRYGSAKVPVRVAVVDFVGDNLASFRSIHSASVSRVIRNLACQEGNRSNCETRIGPVPGVSKERRKAAERKGTPNDDREYGDYSDYGDFLTFAELQDSLTKALATWQPGREHLVIDIAVAWDPIKIDPDDAVLGAIRQTLQRASCLGAILIAPAGNASGSGSPLFPGGFEVKKAPSVAECAELKVAAHPASIEPYAPLVYAVGGLDALDQRMAIVRRWGQPRLAAYGLGVTVPGPKELPYGYPLSGTSMSAAIVSGVAAAVWTVRPELDAHQVMALVYQGGIPLDGGINSKHAQTEFCLDQAFGPCREWGVRRAFLCGALAAALPDEKLECLSKPSTSATLPLVPKDQIPSGLPPAPPPCALTGCGVALGPTVTQLPKGAVPQPGISGCLGCVLNKNYFGAGLGLVSGTLSWDTTAPPPLTSAIVKTYNNWFVSNDVDYNLTTWPSNQAFYRFMTVRSDTYAATLTVSYDIGYSVSSPELSLGVQ